MFLHLSLCPRRGWCLGPGPGGGWGVWPGGCLGSDPGEVGGLTRGGGVQVHTWGVARPHLGVGGVSRHMPGGSRLTPRSVQVHTRGGAGCVQAHAWGSRPRGVQVHTWGCPGPYPGDGGCVQAHAWGGPDPGPGRVSRDRPRGCITACTEADTCPPSDSYCYGRYASYWNAFLFTWRFTPYMESVLKQRTILASLKLYYKILIYKNFMTFTRI